MPGKVDPSEIEEKTPFTEQLWGRVIPVGNIHDPQHDIDALPEFAEDEEWINFIPGPDGELQFYIGEPAESVYFGVEPENENKDIHLTFLELYYQHLTWPDITGLLPSLLDDIRNLAISLSKVSIFQNIVGTQPLGIQRLVKTELEYIFMVSRSLYDGLQFIIANTWDKLYPTDDDTSFDADLPTSSFRKMALEGGEPVTVESLQERYNIPEGLAEFYSNEAPIFDRIRDFRDAIAHQGDSPQTIFSAESGLAVNTNSEPYCDFDAWQEEHLMENDLAPLWPFVAAIVDQTISSLQRYVEGLLKEPLYMPPQMAEGYNLYVRGYHIPNINYLESLKTVDPWGEEFTQAVKDRLSYSN